MSDNRLMAAEVGGKADILDVALRSLSAELELPAENEELQLDVSWETSFERRLGEVSVAFSAFPYAREIVQSLTARASLPPLILGTLRAPIDPAAEGDSKPPKGRAPSAKKGSSTRARKAPATPRKAAKRKA